jgi:hypothetical protein
MSISTHRFTTVLFLGLFAAALASAQAGVNMIGRQSQNEGLLVVPAPRKVVIDGEVGEWDWSGRMWVFADADIRSRFSVEAAGMWDAQYLYLAAKWKDPTPMYSTVNPAFNPEEGWKSDSWQLRLQTDRVAHLTTWCFTEKGQPVMHISYAEKGVGGKVLTGAPGSAELGDGVAMAYHRDADGKGYVQELRLPWAFLYKTAPEIKPGLIFRLGNEFLWGDATGRTWPMHRYADNMQPGVTSREFYWTNTKAWGTVELMATGNLPIRQYVAEGVRLPGTIPVRVIIPATAARFTVAINDAQGKRVRNLAGDSDPENYSVAVDGDRRTVEVLWDGLDDRGRLVAPGTYRIVGLTHGGLNAVYDMTVFNPGTPPWETKDGTGSWGADHMAPKWIAASGEWMIIGWPGVEGGSGIIGIGPDGKKRWGEKRGAVVLAADDRYVYAIANSWYASGVLCRFGKTDDSNQPFVLDGKPRPFELPMAEIFGKDVPGKVTGMAAHGDRLVLSMSEGKLAILDAATASLKRQFELPAMTSLAFSRDGRLYGLAGEIPQAIDLTTGTATALTLPGLGKASALAVDREGNLVVTDIGPDCQAKAYSPAGKLIYTAGVKGGRPLRGKFNPQAMMAMTGVAVDAVGQLWVVEGWENPRRVSVWNRAGKLVRDYLGNTGYAGTNVYLDEKDPTLAYSGPVEMKLDRKTNSWAVTSLLWVPDQAKGEAFPLWTHPHWFSNPTFVTSRASGKDRRYLYYNGTYSSYHAVYLPVGDASWQPVVAVTTVGALQEMLPQLQLTGHKPKETLFWNDTNGDARVTLDECAFLGEERNLFAHWGNRLGSDLCLYVGKGTRIRPVAFTKAGAPIYAPAGVETLPVKADGEFVAVPEEKLLLNLGSTIAGIELDGSAMRWSYPNPYPGVHGSHLATMPKPGLVIGALKFHGVAEVNKGVGRVFAIRGNLGQDYFLTTDGLYVGALFQDGRIPAAGLPETEAALRGKTLEGFTEGGEPFNGWFGKQRDGKCRLVTSFARQAGLIVEVTGLESIQRFTAPALTVDAATLVKAEGENMVRQAAAAKPKSYSISRLATPLAVDGVGTEWAKIPALTIERAGSPNRGTAKLAYDAENLYLLYEVNDTSPWLNEGKDYTRLFKTGDAVDLHLGPAGKAHREPQAGDRRLVFAALNGKPAAVLMVPIDPTAPEALTYQYTSPVQPKRFARVEVLTGVKVAVKVERERYRVEAAIPLTALGLTLTPGLTLRGDLGLISSDVQGMTNVARTYWVNKATNLVNDLPSEAWLYPETWGELKVE